MSRLSPPERASALLRLHADGVLVLPNAWDVASAALFAQAGAPAVATTSAGLAWSQGYRDGEQLPRADLFRLLRRIAEVVDVPVTADLEAGFGADEVEVSQTVTAVLEAGVVGINLEDGRPGGDGVFDLPEAAARIAAARKAAVAHGVADLVINGRTDVYMRGVGDPSGRPAEVLRRAEAFAAAGADCLFVAGLSDLRVLSDLAADSPLPINVFTAAGGATVEQLRAAGVRRVTVGPALAQAAYTAAGELARELLGAGTLTAGSPWLGYGALNTLFPPAPTEE